MTITELKVKYSLLFDELCRKWSRKAREATHGSPDRQWAYTQAEREFVAEMKQMGDVK